MNIIWFRSYLNGLAVFPTFFKLSLNLAIRSSWSETQSTEVEFIRKYRLLQLEVIPLFFFSGLIMTTNLYNGDCVIGDSICSSLVTKPCLSFFVTPWTETTRLLCPQGFPDNKNGMGCSFLLQGSSKSQDHNYISCFAGAFFTTDPWEKTSISIILNYWGFWKWTLKW